MAREKKSTAERRKISPYYELKEIKIMSEAKKITLTIGERLAAVKLFDAFKGSLSTLSTLIEDVKVFPMSEEEWTKAGLVKTPNADGTENWKWSEEGNTKEIDVQEPTVQYLKDEIKKKSDAGEITISDIALSTLNSKLVL